jgi:hypothetical protein
MSKFLLFRAEDAAEEVAEAAEEALLLLGRCGRWNCGLCNWCGRRLWSLIGKGRDGERRGIGSDAARFGLGQRG